MKTKHSSILLSKRQTEVLHAMHTGETSIETASRLRISPRTVETYRERTMHAMGAKNFTQAYLRAIESASSNRRRFSINRTTFCANPTFLYGRKNTDFRKSDARAVSTAAPTRDCKVSAIQESSRR